MFFFNNNYSEWFLVPVSIIEFIIRGDDVFGVTIYCEIKEIYWYFLNGPCAGVKTLANLFVHGVGLAESDLQSKCSIIIFAH